MKNLRGGHRERLRGSFRLACGMAASLTLLLGVQTSSAAPNAWHVSSLGELYEFDVTTGDYSLALTFAPPVDCVQLTRAGDSLFCADPEQFSGTWVRRLEASSATVGWQANFPDLESPDGIASANSLLYVVAHENQPSRFFLLTLDPADGEELNRVEISELSKPSQRAYTMAARGSELWLMVPANSGGTAVRRLDPLTGVLHESVMIPEISSPSDADFGPDGRLFLSDWNWNPTNTGWCTDYWIVSFPGGSPDPQFSHCWHVSQGHAPPNLAFFTLAEGSSAPVAEIPTLSAAALWVLVALLAMVGVLVLRRSGRVSAG